MTRATLAAGMAGVFGAVVAARLELMHPLFGLFAGMCCALVLILWAEGDGLAAEDFANDLKDEWEGY
ncbi:hypothetical protein [Martelella soudanensis]|uniref:hypothetical protein n=1 Tax=unclassified Martelella TaxID=2629616 RepID=UPI0015DFC71D|nr:MULTISPECIES: hypothetical protein [unclassified Martelella]